MYSRSMGLSSDEEFSSCWGGGRGERGGKEKRKGEWSSFQITAPFLTFLRQYG